MSGPVITVDLKKIEDNTRVIVDFCGEYGIDVIGVSKVTCGMPSVAKAMIAGGVKGIGESRIENINARYFKSETNSFACVRCFLSRSTEIFYIVKRD